MNILNYIPEGAECAVSREVLRMMTGLSDRAVRREIQEAKESGSIILNTMDGRGYFQPRLPQEQYYLKNQYKANQARLISMSKQQKHLRKLMKAQGIE